MNSSNRCSSIGAMAGISASWTSWPFASRFGIGGERKQLRQEGLTAGEITQGETCKEEVVAGIVGTGVGLQRLGELLLGLGVLLFFEGEQAHLQQDIGV